MSIEITDPEEESFYQRAADGCVYKYSPCGGCVAGGMCWGAGLPPEDEYEDCSDCGEPLDYGYCYVCDEEDEEDEDDDYWT